MSEMPAIALRDNLRAFVTAPTWAASRAIVTEHQAVLLTDVADKEFATWIAEEAVTAADQYIQILHWYRDVLRRCQSGGIDATFADLPTPRPLNKALQAFLALSQLETLSEVVQGFPELLSIPAIEVVQAAINQMAETDQDRAGILQSRLEQIKTVELIRRPISDDLAVLLQEWIATETWGESKALLTAHSERLLSDEAFAALTGLSLAATQAGDEHSEILMQHLTILEAARSTSIDAAYAELLKPSPLAQALHTLPADLRQGLQALIAAKNTSELLECVQQHPLLLTSEATTALDTLLETLRIAGEEDTVAGIEERYSTLKQIIAGAVSIPSDQLASLLIAWINTDSWEQSKELLEANAERLLSDEALALLATLLQDRENQDDKAKRTLLQHRSLLETARTQSIDAAYADLLLSSSLKAAFNALWQANSPAQVQQVLHQYPILLEEQTRQTFITLVENMERDGKAELAQTMRLRLDLLRRLSEHQIQAAAAAERYEEQHEGGRPEIEITATGGGMGAYGGRDVYQHQTYIAHNEPLATRWQRPARQRLIKPFVGRQRDLEALKQRLLVGENLTITSQALTAALWGMAGVGKTFLARQLSIELDAQFPGGVIWVKMGPDMRTEADAATALNTIARYAFGGHQLVEVLDPDTVRSWLATVSPGRLLVVFDDAWSQAALQFLDQALPDNAVRIITTRRANVAQIFGRNNRYQLDCFTPEDGLALLENRLQDMDIDPYRQYLKELVALLGGHALSLDIAAGLMKRAPHIPRIVEDLKQDIGRSTLKRLDLSDQIPTEDLRDSNVERSLSLSYYYMSPEQQRCFRVLGAFAPDSLIAPEAVVAVWGMSELDTQRMLDTLEALALVNEAEEPSALFYRQHSLLHTYASALLKEDGEEAAAGWAHASYYTQLVRQTEIANYSLLDLVLPNILRALAWTGKHEPVLCSQLVEVAFQFLLARGQSQQLELYLPIALAAATTINARGRQANLLRSLGDLESRLGNIDQAWGQYDAALPLYRAERARLGEANVLKSLGDLERRLGNIDQAWGQYDAALPLYRAERDRLGEANVYLSLADLYLMSQEWLQAKTWYERALPLFVAEQDPLGQANTLIDLGRARFVLGEHAQGIADVQQAVALFQGLHDHEWEERATQYLLAMHQALAQAKADPTSTPLSQDALLQTFVSVQSSQDLLQLVEQHPHLITDQWITRIETIAAAQDNEEIRDVLQERLEVLKEIRARVEASASLRQEARAALAAFSEADWGKRRQLLTDSPILLQETVIEPLFTDLLAAARAQGDSDAVHYFEQLHILLRRCRTWEIDAVWYFELRMRLGDNIEIPADYEPAVMQIASLLAQQERHAEALQQAIQAMQTLLDSLPATVPPLFRGALLRDLADRLLALPTSHARRDLTTIEQYYREALSCYQESERPISIANIERSLGELLAEQGRSAEALPLLRKAASMLRESAYEPHHQEAAWAYAACASALDKLGHPDEALSAFEEAIALRPDLAPLYRNRAETLIALRRLPEAEADLAQAVMLDGHENSPYLWYRRAQVAIARGDGQQAANLVGEVLQRDASFDVARVQGQSAWLLGDMQAALTAFQRVYDQETAEGRQVLQREMQTLFAEHPDILGRDRIEAILKEKDV